MTDRAVDKLSIAMVGCGGRARVHAPAARARADIAVTHWLDVDVDKADALAAEFGGQVAPSWEHVLANEEIDGVVVALPHDLHFNYGLAALRAGKHVMMEIPIAATPEEGRLLMRAAEAHGLVLLVLHSLRFWASHANVAGLLTSGVLGDPIFARYHNEHTVPDDYFALQKGHFAAEAGVLHHGDIICWWLGNVKSVTARGLSRGPTARANGTFDHITVLYEIAGNALGETTCSWVTRTCAQNSPVRASVTCTEGSLVLNAQDEIQLFRPDKRLPNGETFQCIPPSGPTRPSGEISHFADCIRGTCEARVSPQDAVRALELTLAARKSAREQRRIPV